MKKFDLKTIQKILSLAFAKAEAERKIKERKNRRITDPEHLIFREA